MKIDAKITICRNSEGEISIDIEDVTSGVSFFSGEMSARDFGQAITGLSFQPIRGDVRGLDKVGKKRLNKTETVICHFPSYSKASREVILDEKIQEIEVDGWVGSSYWALNTQGGSVLDKTLGKDMYRCQVRMVKFVDPEDDHAVLF